MIRCEAREWDIEAVWDKY